MGFFLTDAIQSALTPSGTNARRTQEQQQKLIGDKAYNLWDMINPRLKSQIDYANANEGGRQSAMSRLLALSSPGNVAARRQIVQNRAYSNAADASNMASNANAAAGLSGAYTAGQNQAIANQAAGAMNQYDAQAMDPDTLLKQALAHLQAVAQAQSLPAANDWASFAKLIYGQPQVSVQSNPLGSLLGTIAGDFLTGGVSGLAKTASGGSAQTGGSWMESPYSGMSTDFWA